MNHAPPLQVGCTYRTGEAPKFGSGVQVFRVDVLAESLPPLCCKRRRPGSTPGPCVHLLSCRLFGCPLQVDLGSGEGLHEGCDALGPLAA